MCVSRYFGFLVKSYLLNFWESFLKTPVMKVESAFLKPPVGSRIGLRNLG